MFTLPNSYHVWYGPTGIVLKLKLISGCDKSFCCLLYLCSLNAFSRDVHRINGAKTVRERMYYLNEMYLPK